MTELDPHRWVSRRLTVIDIALICAGFAVIAMDFALRKSMRNRISALAKQIDTIAARVDAAQNEPGAGGKVFGRPRRGQRAVRVVDAMKRQALIRHVESHGCRLLREGGKHSV